MELKRQNLNEVNIYRVQFLNYNIHTRTQGTNKYCIDFMVKSNR